MTSKRRSRRSSRRGTGSRKRYGNEVPGWPGASAVYSYLYRVLEKMGADGWKSAVAEAKRNRKKVRPWQPSAEMKGIIKALDTGDEETLKAMQMKYKLR